MCRLLGYATAGFNLSLNAVLGQDNVEDFRELSEIHNDGWGVAQLSDPAEAPHVRDGGAPTPETGTRIYKSTIAARHDSTFETLAERRYLGRQWPQHRHQPLIPGEPQRAPLHRRPFRLRHLLRGDSGIHRLRLLARRGRGPGRARTAPSLPEVQLQLHDSVRGPAHRPVRRRS